jgi:hypothetical protein
MVNIGTVVIGHRIIDAAWFLCAVVVATQWSKTSKAQSSLVRTLDNSLQFAKPASAHSKQLVKQTAVITTRKRDSRDTGRKGEQAFQSL